MSDENISPDEVVETIIDNIVQDDSIPLQFEAWLNDFVADPERDVTGVDLLGILWVMLGPMRTIYTIGEIAKFTLLGIMNIDEAIESGAYVDEHGDTVNVLLAETAIQLGYDRGQVVVPNTLEGLINDAADQG